MKEVAYRLRSKISLYYKRIIILGKAFTNKKLVILINSSSISSST